MTSRDTYDIDEYAKESPVNPEEGTGLLPSYPSVHPWFPVYSSFPKMVEITRWHADEQVRAFRELLA